jgi:hypothetical protein
MGVTAGIFLASILLKEMRYLVYIRYLWIKFTSITCEECFQRRLFPGNTRLPIIVYSVWVVLCSNIGPIMDLFGEQFKTDTCRYPV